MRMKSYCRFGLWIIVAAGLLFCASCRKKDYSDLPIVGHWGCAEYVSCRTDAEGHEQWDTIPYDVKPGCDYEIYFYEDGSGKLLLNNSPALFKKFSCTYEYDANSNLVIIRGEEWLYFLYKNYTHGQKEADFDVESMEKNSFVASWMNRFSEPVPFFEKFYLQRID